MGTRNPNPLVEPLLQAAMELREAAKVFRGHEFLSADIFDKAAERAEAAAKRHATTWQPSDG